MKDKKLKHILIFCYMLEPNQESCQIFQRNVEFGD
jgi:hypothetical protein